MADQVHHYVRVTVADEQGVLLGDFNLTLEDCTTGRGKPVTNIEPYIGAQVLDQLPYGDLYKYLTAGGK